MVKKCLRFIVLMALFILTLGLVVSLHSSSEAIVDPPQLNFAIGGCEEAQHLQLSSQPQTCTQGKSFSPVRDIAIEVQGQNLIFSHALTYVCCAELRLESQIEKNAIAITEINDGEFCRCMCNYSVDASLGPLEPGSYDLKVYGVQYGDGSVPELLFQRQVTVP